MVFIASVAVAAPVRHASLDRIDRQMQSACGNANFDFLQALGKGISWDRRKCRGGPLKAAIAFLR